MTTPLDRYFDLLDYEGQNFAGLGDLFADDASAFYGGEVAQGRSWVVELHKAVLLRRRRSVHTWTTEIGEGGRLFARWNETGLDPAGKKFTASGSAEVALDESGQITRLRLSFDVEGPHKARAIVGRHLEAWTIADVNARHQKIKESYTEDIRYSEMDEVLVGYEEVSARIDKVLEMAPPALIRLDGIIENHDYIQWEFSFVYPNGGKARGWEVLHLEEDRIASLVVFTPDMGAIVAGIK
jgi:hypothetical protein